MSIDSSTTGAAAGLAGVSLPGPGAWLRWMLVWAGVGLLVAAGIAFSSEQTELRPALVQSLVLAELLGLSVLVSTRLIFPLLNRFPYLVRTATQAAVLFSSAVLGSTFAFAFRPLYALANWKMVLTIVLVNALVAVIVGIAWHTFELMRRQIEASYRLLRDKEAFERELEIAREVQRGLLPRDVPDLGGLELSGVCIPAIAVGGDYYDFVPLTSGGLGVVIADVSGKGIPASLLVASLHASVRSSLAGAADPPEVAARVNRLLCEASISSRYATLLVGCYDEASRVLTHTNAGHLPGLLLRGDELRRLEARGMPVGLFDDARYGVGRERLEPDDLLALFTDGVLEMPGPGEEEFGEERLVGLLREHRRRPLAEVQQHVVDALRDWNHHGEGYDDVTLVLLRAR